MQALARILPRPCSEPLAEARIDTTQKCFETLDQSKTQLQPTRRLFQVVLHAFQGYRLPQAGLPIFLRRVWGLHGSRIHRPGPGPGPNWRGSICRREPYRLLMLLDTCQAFAKQEISIYDPSFCLRLTGSAGSS